MRIDRRQILGGGMAAGAMTLLPAASRAAGGAGRLLVFGHRGACALRPEHTLASYAQAIADGADFVEPDLVATRDGVLVARHENHITDTTDVAAHPEFAGRRTIKTINGNRHDGWFVEDFTLAEIKRLRAVERIPDVRPANVRYNGQFQIPTWDEIIDFVAAESATRGRVIGLVPELKLSTYFAGIGLPIEDRFLAVLDAHDYSRRNPVIVQSFEVANLRYLKAQKKGRDALRLLQLIDEDDKRPADVVAAHGATGYPAMRTPDGLRAIATYADMIGPFKEAIFATRSDGTWGPPTTLIADAHAVGLGVIPWTFRPENSGLPPFYRNRQGVHARNPAGAVAEIRAYRAAGVDGIFTDDPAVGRSAALG